MRAMLLSEIGKPLAAAEAPEPAPGLGEVLIAVEACGVNYADLLLTLGKYQERPEPPFAPGMEVAGRVAALGAETAGLAVGDPVAALVGAGGMAERVTAPAALCAKLPEAMSPEVAAALPIAYGTSHLALAKKAALQPGERLLVLGAAGGVGLTAVEIGALMGAEVIACARGADRLETAKAKGAAHLIDSETADLKEAVKALGGADVIYDPVGGSLGEAAFRAGAVGARILPIGFASGDLPSYPPNILLVKNQTVIGFYWGGHLKRRPEDFAYSMAACVAWWEAGRLTPHISDHLPMTEANAAIRLLADRKAKGKVVLSGF